MRIIVVKWEEGFNYEDLLPIWIVGRDWETDYFVHEVRGLKGGISYARCSVRVRGNKAELDYAHPHLEYNKKRGNLIGVLTLILPDSDSGEQATAFWNGDDSPGVGTVRFESI